MKSLNPHVRSSTAWYFLIKFNSSDTRNVQLVMRNCLSNGELKPMNSSNLSMSHFKFTKVTIPFHKSPLKKHAFNQLLGEANPHTNPQQ